VRRVGHFEEETNMFTVTCGVFVLMYNKTCRIADFLKIQNKKKEDWRFADISI
jgi:hypothetical protein